MANILEFTNEIQSIGLLDKEITLSSPFKLPLSRDIDLQVQSIQISDRVPNVFNGKPYGVNFDNTHVRISTNIHASQDIQLDAGLYLTADIITAAINAAINDSLHWWLNEDDPGLTVVSNDVIDKVTIEIDSTKLDPVHGNQFLFDIRQATTNSDMRLTLGFIEANSYMIVDGLYTSDFLPKLDTQGTYCNVRASFMPLRKVGTEVQRTVANVSFAGKLNPSDNLWPMLGVLSPKIVYDGDREISSYTVSVKTDKGLPMIFLNGLLYFSIAFYT